MKPLLFILIILSSFQVNSQDTTTLNLKPKTELQKLDLKVGAILKKQYYDVYNAGCLWNKKVNFQLLNIKDAASNTSLWGLYISIDYENSNAGSSYAVYIDKDEFPAIIRFIDFLSKNDSTYSEIYTEYIYNFKDFQLYTYSNTFFKKEIKTPGKNEVKTDKQNDLLSSSSSKQAPWLYGLRLDKYSSRAVTYIEFYKLKEFKNRLIEEMTKIEK